MQPYENVVNFQTLNINIYTHFKLWAVKLVNRVQKLHIKTHVPFAHFKHEIQSRRFKNVAKTNAFITFQMIVMYSCISICKVFLYWNTLQMATYVTYQISKI